LQKLINPLVISHGWTADSKLPNAVGTFGNSPFIDEIEMQGTGDPAAWLSVPSAIAFRRDHGWEQVARQCTELAQETARRMGDLTGLSPLSTPEFCAPQMVAIPLPDTGLDPQAFHDLLLDHYQIEIPVLKWRDHYIVRLSVQGYNSKPQMDILVEALTEILELDRPQELVRQHG
jgi:isopenicillin-N epimerase